MTESRAEQLRLGNVLREHRQRIRALEARPVSAGGVSLVETYYAPDFSIVVGGAYTAPGATNLSISSQMYVVGHLAHIDIIVELGGAGGFTPGNAPAWTLQYASLDLIGQTMPVMVGGAGVSAGVGLANDFSASVATPVYTWFASSMTQSIELACNGPGVTPLPPLGYNTPYVWANNDIIFLAALDCVVAYPG